MIFAVIGFSVWLQINYQTKTKQSFDGGYIRLASQMESNPLVKSIPSLKARLELTQSVAARSPAIIQLSDLDATARKAQDIALASSQILTNTRDARSRLPFRVEIMTVAQARSTELANDELKKFCETSPGNCYKLEVYNYGLNSTNTLIVDVGSNRVIGTTYTENSQPEIGPELRNLATDIAINSKEVQDALGYKPESKNTLMAGTKTSLVGSKCERSNHLCVAPTFVADGKAHWAIVDLTDYVLVGVKTTNVGDVTGVSEKKLQNELIVNEYCKKSHTIDDTVRSGWKIDYQLTSSDGMMVSNVTYKGKPVIDSIKLVDWHVSYSRTDGFGYSDAVGCPLFSQAAVLAVNPPFTKDILDGDGKLIGWKLDQYFESELWPKPCNYYYEQEFEFYLDGSFRPIAASVGRGCGDDGTYRPVTRIAFAQDMDAVTKWGDNRWNEVSKEGYAVQSESSIDGNGAIYKLKQKDGTEFSIIPSHGQFTDKSKTWVHTGDKGDNAYIYWTRANAGEGDTDLSTIGPCCNIDYHQGPDKYLNNETISGQKLVLWYVAQIKNNATPGQEYCWADTSLVDGLYKKIKYPCHSGPLIKP